MIMISGQPDIGVHFVFYRKAFPVIVKGSMVCSKSHRNSISHKRAWKLKDLNGLELQIPYADGPFESKSKGKTVLIGVVFRGGSFMDGLLKSEIEIDGEDAEDTIVKITNKTKHKDQLRVIMLDGITFGGFNTVDRKSTRLNSSH